MFLYLGRAARDLHSWSREMRGNGMEGKNPDVMGVRLFRLCGHYEGFGFYPKCGSHRDF